MKSGKDMHLAISFILCFEVADCLFLAAANRPRFQFFEKIVTLIVDENESGEVFDTNFPNGLHTDFGEFDTFDALNRVHRQDGGGSTDAAQVETAVLFASVGYGLCAVAFGNHYHRTAVVLKFVDIGIHAVGGGGPHRATGHANRSKRRSGLQHGQDVEV